jgi:hypothetical protein
MLSDTAKADYIDRAGEYVNLMLRHHQWDGLTHSAVNNWIANFPTQLQYIAWRLLSHLIYYSANDLRALLREVLIHHILGAQGRADQLAARFALYPSRLRHDTEIAKHRTLITVLLAADQPGESGPGIARMAGELGLTQQALPDAIHEVAIRGRYDRLVILDDNVGSGDQFEDFWTTYQLASKQLLSDWAASSGLHVVYISLVGTLTAISRLRQRFPSVTFATGQMLTDEYTISATTSGIWADADERSYAIAELTTLAQQHGLSLAGYRELDFVVILSRTIPDWTSPLLWKRRADWTPLLTRKNSDA